MKRTKTAFANRVVTLAMVCVCVANLSADADNRGVRNGPLDDLTFGHRAEHEGNTESLRLAVEYLMKTYGAKYPKGKGFLTRLEAISDEKSEAFSALKKEALVEANPAINFDNLLLVKGNVNSSRLTAAWASQAAAYPQYRPYTEKDFKAVVNTVLKQDKDLDALYRKREAAHKPVYAQIPADKRRGYRDPKRREGMIKDFRGYPEYKKAKDAFHAAGMENKAYREAYNRWQNGGTIRSYVDELVILPLRGEDKGKMRTIYKPNGPKFIGEVDLHFDANKLLFTSFRDMSQMTQGPGRGKGYAVFELRIDPQNGEAIGEPKLMTPDMGSDVDCYDACYLPDGKIIFASTASYVGVPCVGGHTYVASLFRIDEDGTGVRRLTFDQDGNWDPSVLSNGRVMFLRWEYTDIPHYFSRVLMTMNPDGTDQKAYYGSNSYWPNALNSARQIPNQPNQFAAVVGGHHSGKTGPIVIFDVSKGRHEVEGVVQMLTARGKKVHPLVLDHLGKAYSPHFISTYPIDGSFFLATRGGRGSAVCLIDVFDNVVPLAKGMYYDPVPLRPTPTPHVLPDRLNVDSNTANVLINDVYLGPGLAGVPRGTVKGLRVYRYEYGARDFAGNGKTGLESGWDMKQVMGVVPVEDDGSVHFSVPANTPFAMHPLDAQGRALQLMRSWTVAMPGEDLSCIGCHEEQGTAPADRYDKARMRAPSTLTPLGGKLHGFNFKRDIQPILDKYCVSCHDGQPAGKRYTASDRVIGTGRYVGKTFAEAGIPDLRDPKAAYNALIPFVRQHGAEGDYHLQTPLNFHTSASPLFQMLEKGHHNVKLDDADLRTLITWADLSAPYFGTWTEAGGDPAVLERRLELRKLYANVDYDAEVIHKPYKPLAASERVMPEPVKFEPVAAKKPEIKGSAKGAESIDLGDDLAIKLVQIPAGTYSMGSNSETPRERPVSRVTVDEPFLMGTTEITLAQYRQFDPHYLNGVYDMRGHDQESRGYYMNDMDFPVIRVSWDDAMAFCKWLSEKTGKKVTLPTEAQWEWACRAGTTTPLSFGDLHSNFSAHANLADASLTQLAVAKRKPDPKGINNEIKDTRSDDGVMHLAEFGSYKPNPWGLHDMHGNAAEWTRSDYRDYPYVNDDGRNAGKPGRKAVRGGSWADRLFSASSSYRLGYDNWQKVHNVGFRIVVEE